MLALVLPALLAGCAAAPAPQTAPPPVTALPAAAPPAARDWLDPADPAVIEKAVHCLMLRTALADTAHAWLWLDLELSEGGSVRVLGPAALTFELLEDGAPRRVDDAGLFVALDDDANSFLNSSRGAITVRTGRVASTAGRVRLLARLPRVDTARTVVHHVSPIPDRWIRR